MSGMWKTRAALNWVNLSTLLGLAVARAARCDVDRGPEGLWLARDYPWAFPAGGAFTVGSVILARPGLSVESNPRLLAHEARHAWQYAACLGLPFLPLYGLCAAYSVWRTGSPALSNPFERDAGLEAGGYIGPQDQDRF
ncbi:hypothetical protein [Arthrobacter sp. Y-9]|uniref:hypothetical protein n=1 Tax=Arthrobacter sp. Y-9 TaxID=3039385 RepID=UPI00241FB96B|nr:hypothetical protein [Arthrobacter sp. Y-9]WFR85131.1 hypothetical protein P9849_05790 [Arthrobacter sp. Y-9]